MELSDGPASLSKVRPYNAQEVQGALQHAAQLGLSSFSLQQLCNVAGALAAAGHLDAAFMQQLGDAAAAQLKAAPRVTTHVQGVRALRIVCWLAVGFARLGVLHAGLFEQVALYATHLLQRCPLKLSKRRQGQQLALLAAAFAALRLYPPQLFAALGDHLKLHRRVVKLLGAQESMLLLWALARVGHRDPPTQLWITQRAATQVGQLTCQGLAHAYTQCAAVSITSAPLLAALRKAARVKLGSMQPADLAAMLAALAALGQQDLLLLDELSRAVFNKLANFSAAEVSASLTALAALRYRNSWLLERVSKILVSRKLQKAYALTPQQLAAVLRACQQLSYVNPLLLSHLGSVAAETQVPGCDAQQLAAVVEGYCALGFQQPQLLQAAANRLLQLVVVGASTQAAAVAAGSDEQQQQHHYHVSAALQLVSMPPAAATSAERAVLPAALLGITAHALGLHAQQQQQQKDSGQAVAGSAVTTSSSGSQAGSLASPALLDDLLALQAALLLCISRSAGVAAAAVPPSSTQQGDTQAAAAPAPAAAAALSQVLLELSALQPQVELCIQQQLVAVVAASGTDADAAAEQLLVQHAGLLQCMQLLWVLQQCAAADGGAAATGHSTPWRLGLSQQVADACASQHQQQQQQQAQVAPQAKQMLQAVARALQDIGSEAGQQPAQVQLQYCLPGSPMVVPVAVLPAVEAVEASAAAAAAISAQPGSAQQHQGNSNDGSTFLHVQTQLRRRKLQLPAEAQAFVAQHRHSRTPVAVFVCGSSGSGSGGGAESSALPPAWHTSNAPQQMLPAARLWLQGLQAAGWAVLLVGEQEQEQDGE